MHAYSNDYFKFTYMWSYLKARAKHCEPLQPDLKPEPLN